MKHSQGPWLFNNCTVYQKNSGNSDGSCRSPIAFTGCFLLDDGTNTVEECQANARLIAAAPEMLDALKKAQIELGSWIGCGAPQWTTDVYNQVSDAIAKARG